jgi:hypothetical protein
MKQIIPISVISAALAIGTAAASETGALRHSIAAGEEGKFCGWPANNGVWSWDGGREILVGYTIGDFVEQKGHNMKNHTESGEHLLSHLARSTDGGITWKTGDPANYVGDGQSSVPSPGGIAFDAPGFAMRVVGTGYHGAHDENGSFFVSYNRGQDWKGPYQFNGLMEDPNLKGKEFTGRTEYLVTGPDSCLLFLSSRGSDEAYRDKSFVAETTDGGKTFRFVSWIVPLKDPHRAVMPAAARLKDGSLVAALRRRDSAKGDCWVDAYGSTDHGRTWTFLSRVGEAGKENGNPPALVALGDGRIACAYGDRSRVKMYVRLSSDGGKTWGEEVVLRDDFQPDKFGDNDFGYPRLAVNHGNDIAAMYYWATKDQPQHHIAATLWNPGPP